MLNSLYCSVDLDRKSSSAGKPSNQLWGPCWARLVHPRNEWVTCFSTDFLAISVVGSTCCSCVVMGSLRTCFAAWRVHVKCSEWSGLPPPVSAHLPVAGLFCQYCSWSFFLSFYWPACSSRGPASAASRYWCCRRIGCYWVYSWRDWSHESGQRSQSWYHLGFMIHLRTPYCYSSPLFIYLSQCFWSCPAVEPGPCLWRRGSEIFAAYAEAFASFEKRSGSLSWDLKDYFVFQPIEKILGFQNFFWGLASEIKQFDW